MYDFTDWVKNRSLTCMADSFDPPFVKEVGGWGQPMTRVTTGVFYQPNGDILLRVYAPKAREVHADIRNMGGKSPSVVLEKQDDGVFEGVFPYDPELAGARSVVVYIDGTESLIPDIPHFFSFGRLTNYIEYPSDSFDDILIKDVPHGSVTSSIYWSRTMDNWVRCLVYTPPGYNKSTEEYPVLYLQHGIGENETSWVYGGKLPMLMDNMIAAGACKPFVVVMNHGILRRDMDGPLEMDSFLEILTDDCIPYIEEEYRVQKDKWGRALAGLSYGGMTTSRLGFSRPDLFGYLGLFSSWLRCHDFWVEFEDNHHLDELRRDPAFLEKNYRVFFRSCGSFEHDKMDFRKKRFLHKEEDELIRALGIDKMPCYHHHLYPNGTHTWDTFRKGFCDFAKLIF